MPCRPNPARERSRTALLALLLALAGCGSAKKDVLDLRGDAGPGADDAGENSTDAGPHGLPDMGGQGVECPPVGAGTPIASVGACPFGPAIPSAEGLALPCCHRASNAARPDGVELRITSLRFDAPRSVAATTRPLITGLFQNAIDEERFNWVVQVTGGCGAVGVRMGGALRATSGALSLLTGRAPALSTSNPLLADTARWDPIDVLGTLDDEVLATEPIARVVVPVFDAAGALIVEAPFRDLVLEDWRLHEDRTCVGARDTSVPLNEFAEGGTLRGFVALEDVLGIYLDQGPLDDFLCRFLADAPDGSVDCVPSERSRWRVLPDARCEAEGCTAGSCAPETTCNAWSFAGAISAAGAEVI